MAITYTDNGTNTPNGTHRIFTYSFPVLQTEDIKVALNGIVQATNKYTASLSPARIEFNSTNADATVQNTSTGAPLTGVLVRVYRQTTVGKNSGDEDPKAVFAAGSSIRATDLNANQEQALFAIHELQNQEVLQEKIGTGAVTSSKILDGTIVNADINASAAIDGTKVTPNFGSQNISTTGTINNLTTTELAILDGATVTTAELNKLDGFTGSTDNLNAISGVTATSTEINTLDGITASTAELNKLDGVTSTTAELNILDGVTATASEINKLDGVTASTAELNLLDGVSASTTELNYVDNVTSPIQSQLDGKQPLDSELTELATMPSATASALADLTQAEVQTLDGVTASTAEINKLDGVTASTSEINLLDGVTATTNEINKLDGVTATTTELNLLDGVTATTTELNLNDGQTATPAEVNILDGATLNTNELNKLDGVTASTAELNLLDGKSIVTSISGSATDTQIPSAQAVNERITTVVQDVGGFVPIANETSFPTANPDLNDAAGTIVSIKALASAFTTGSGVTTHTISNGAGSGKNVTITGLTQATTYPAGRGLILETTQYSGGGRGGNANEYEYAFHRLTLDETGVADAQAAIDDFDERYYGPFSANQATRPSGANRQNGDLYFNTSDGKMKVFNGSHASGTWDDVAAPGNFFINTLSSSSGSGGGSASFNNIATRFTLSNPPLSAQQLLVSVNGVVQKPNSGTSPSEGFAIDGADIIFASAPNTGAPFFIVTIGSSVNIGTPSDNTVTSAKIVNGSILNEDISSSAAIARTKLANVDLVDDTSPQLGGNLDVNGHQIKVPDLSGADNVIYIGTHSDLQLYHASGGNSYVDDYGGGELLIRGSTIKINKQGSAEVMAKFTQDAAAELYYDNVKKFETTSNGATITGDLSLGDNKTIRLGDGSNGDFRIVHGGTNTTLRNLTGQLQLRSDSLTFENNDGSDFATVTGIKFGDNNRAKFGSGNDLQIYHNGTNSYITNDSGGLNIAGTNVGFTNVGSTEWTLQAISNGAVELFYDGSKKFETYSNGTKLYGNLIGLDAGKYVQWQGSNSNAFAIGMTLGGAAPTGSDQHLQFHHWDNSSWKKVFFVHRDYINIPDNIKIGFGNSNDLTIYHNGSDSTINNNTGNLTIGSDEVRIRGAGYDEHMAKFHKNGTVDLFHDNTLAFQTTASGAQVIDGDNTVALGMVTSNGTSGYLVGISNDTTLIQSGTGENMAAFNKDGSVDLYYDATKRFETRSDGTRTLGRLHQLSADGNTNFRRDVYYLAIPTSSSKTITLASLNGTGTFRAGGYTNAGQGALGMHILFGGAMFATQHYNVNVLMNAPMQNTSTSLSKNATNYTIQISNSSTSYALILQIYLESCGSTMSYSVS